MEQKDVTPNEKIPKKNTKSSYKSSSAQEKYKIDKLCRQPIAKLKLAKLTPMQIRKFQDQCLLIYNPSTTNKYITLISVAIKHARTMLGIYLPSNPCDFIKRLKEPEFKADIIEPEEEKLLWTISLKTYSMRQVPYRTLM